MSAALEVPADRTKTSRSRLEKALLRYIFHTLLTSGTEKIAVDIEESEAADNPTAIRLRLPNLLQTLKILLKPDLMIGQTYVDGYWSVQPERLYDFLYLIRSQDASKLQKWFVVSTRFHILRDLLKQRVFPLRATRAVAEHYNTDPHFVSVILGPSMCYTCAFFDGDRDDLESAQERKLQMIADRIALAPGQRVLDLGSGWGYATFPLARVFHCDVTGLTISKEQIAFCNERRSQHPTGDRINFVLRDYIGYQPEKPFDRLISIGMLEHVGKYQYKLFFDKVGTLIREDGIALIHSMVSEHESSPDAWIDRNIFPGGYIPTISEVIAGIEESKCELVELFTHPKHYYFRTLEHWKRNLFNGREECRLALRRRGLSEQEATAIIRIWEYFLSSSQIAFSAKYGECRVAHFIVRRKTT